VVDDVEARSGGLGEFCGFDLDGYAGEADAGGEPRDSPTKSKPRGEHHGRRKIPPVSLAYRNPSTLLDALALT
jgi:hypothetical protein